MKKPTLVLMLCILFIVLPIAEAQDNTNLIINEGNAGDIVLISRTDIADAAALVWAPDSSAVAVGDADGLRVIDIATGSTRWQATSNAVAGLSWSYDGQMIAVRHVAGKVTVFEAQTGDPVIIISAANISVAEFAPDDNRLAYNDGSQLYVASMRFGVSDREWQMPSRVHDVQWSADGQHLVVLAQTALLVWDVQAERAAHSFEGSTTPYQGIALSNAGYRFAATHPSDNSIAIAPLEDPANTLPLIGHEDRVIDVQWSPDDLLLASVGADDVLLVWDVEEGRVLSRLTLVGASGVAWSPDGAWIATTSTAGLSFWGLRESIGDAPIRYD